MGHKTRYLKNNVFFSPKTRAIRNNIFKKRSTSQKVMQISKMLRINETREKNFAIDYGSISFYLSIN